MSAIKYSPYIPDVDAWVKFYENQPKEYKNFYTIGKAKQKGEDMQPMKLVSPTEMAVDQARASVKREREIEDALLPILKKIKGPVNKKRQIKPSSRKGKKTS